MISHTKKILLSFIGICFFTSCSGEKIPERKIYLANIEKVSQSAWTNLAKKNIFFGHQSIGFDIIEGIKNLLKENPRINLKIIYGNFTTNLHSPVLAHYKIGHNGDPMSKISNFADVMTKNNNNTIDIAFFKFCYIDFTYNSNIKSIINSYKTCILTLQHICPETTLIHFTVPLTFTKTGIKTWIKQLLRKNYIWEYDDNIQRSRFNDLLRQEFKDSGHLFDLAAIESTFPNGERCSFTRNGRVNYSLVPDYTSDGSHLNKLGRKKVAEQLLILLAGVSSQS